jgi:hypothetical protein
VGAAEKGIGREHGEGARLRGLARERQQGIVARDAMARARVPDQLDKLLVIRIDSGLVAFARCLVGAGRSSRRFRML